MDEGEVPEPELLRLALSQVAEALGELNMSSEPAQLHLEKLDELLSKRGSNVIYSLGAWLKTLGLKLTITVSQEAENKSRNSASDSELTV